MHFWAYLSTGKKSTVSHSSHGTLKISQRCHVWSCYDTKTFHIRDLEVPQQCIWRCGYSGVWYCVADSGSWRLKEIYSLHYEGSRRPRRALGILDPSTWRHWRSFETSRTTKQRHNVKKQKTWILNVESVHDVHSQDNFILKPQLTIG